MAALSTSAHSSDTDGRVEGAGGMCAAPLPFYGHAIIHDRQPIY